MMARRIKLCSVKHFRNNRCVKVFNNFCVATGLKFPEMAKLKIKTISVESETPSFLSPTTTERNRLHKIAVAFEEFTEQFYLSMDKDDHELRHVEVLDNLEHVDNDCTQTLNFNIEQIF